MNAYPKVCAIHGSPTAGHIQTAIVKANLKAIERILTSPERFPQADPSKLVHLAVEYIGILTDRGFNIRIAA